jgi:hypothetical protein
VVLAQGAARCNITNILNLDDVDGCTIFLPYRLYFGLIVTVFARSSVANEVSSCSSEVPADVGFDDFNL